MEAFKDWLSGIDLQWIITELMVVVAAVISLTVHECSHALAAKWLGDDTAKRLGRLTLNPLRHLSWSGLLMLAVFRFGWARPVPIDMRRFRHPRLGMAVSAIAGPISNILLALLSCVILQILYYTESDSAALEYGTSFFTVLLMLNAGLAVFNLIPIPPLDGSKVLAMFLPPNAHAWLMRYERYGMFVLMALLFFDVLDVPLAFLRDGLIRGLLGLTNLLFGHNLMY